MMVKIERLNNEITMSAIRSLEKEKSKGSGKCNTDEVITALKATFHNKCYICESKSPTDWEVEHLTPHNNDKNLKFNWKNLFWACGNCNHIKGNKYTPILDCTEIEIDEKIAFRKKGYFGIDESLEIEAVADKNNVNVKNTCNLLDRIYHGKTLKEQTGAKRIFHEVCVELSSFKNQIRDYNNAIGEDKKDLYVAIKSKLKSNAEFAAFKRWVVRENPNCKDFLNCWKNENGVSEGREISQ